MKKIMLEVECKDCKNLFKIDHDFLDRVRHINFKFNCPYCGSQIPVDKV